MVERCLGHAAARSSGSRVLRATDFPYWGVPVVAPAVRPFAALAALAFPVAAAAHPLGNFTINRFSRVEVAGPRVYVRYVLDLAEIPTFQAGKIDAQLYARRIARGAELTVNGRRVRLIPSSGRLRTPTARAG